MVGKTMAALAASFALALALAGCGGATAGSSAAGGSSSEGSSQSVQSASSAESSATPQAADGVTLSDDPSDFVLLSEAVPDAILEIRYYSTYNFVGDRIDGYEEPLAFLTKEAAAALKGVSDELVTKGYRLKIYDAYRPQMAVTNFVEWAQDAGDTRMKEYFYPELDKDVLFPQGYIMERSGHSRGSTVDLTLFDMATEKEVDMGGTFDYFGELSHPDYTGITDEQYANRMILRDAMLAHGFKPLAEEWWHFTLADEPYPDTYFTFPVNSESLDAGAAADKSAAEGPSPGSGAVAPSSGTQAASTSSDAAGSAGGKAVYFAAPLFNKGEMDFNQELVELLEGHGYQVFLPQRDGYLAAELEGKTEEEMTQLIFDKDRGEVMEADICFAVLDGRAPDEGACVELGIAYANGKRCYGVKTDARSVEYGMDLNPMIAGCCEKVFKNIDGEKLVEELDRYLSENEL